MFEKIGRLAETAANKVSVSRRGFLGRLGQGALAAAGVLGGLLALPGAAQAGGSVVCCHYRSRRGYGCLSDKFFACLPAGSTCPPYYSPPFEPGCSGRLTSQASKSDCSQC